jgi:Transglycosylase SLT domain/D-alanyl-D-alanine carboxypeptidase/Putative Flp pilus-assembly TadE/G-like
MWCQGNPRRGGTTERGQAALLLLGVIVVLLVGAVVLFAFGSALGARGKHQRGADLAAVSAGQVMRDLYPRLFEAPLLANGLPNPRHLPLQVYLARARAGAVRGGRRNGVAVRPRDVSFAGGGFAPTRVAVRVRGEERVKTALDHGGPGAAIPVRARAAAEIAPDLGAALGQPAYGSGGGYDGPLAYRMGKPMRPDVAAAFDRMAAAARREAGLYLSVTSAFRSDAEQAKLFAANPNPKWVAPPGTSLHRYATELDLGPPAAYSWLQQNHRRFGFIWRYRWEPWHYGYGANPRDRQHPARYDQGSWEPPGGDHGRIHHRLPSFVPPRFHDPIAKAALRWNVPMNVLAAQLYAESGFNPFARSPAGAEGIAQFMPGTADAYGLRNPFDPIAAIDAQAHLMSDLLKQFGGKVALALAGYNAGAGAVEQYGGVPPYAETRAYVAKILGLLGGAGDIAITDMFEVRLVE